MTGDVAVELAIKVRGKRRSQEITVRSRSAPPFILKDLRAAQRGGFFVSVHTQPKTGYSEDLQNTGGNALNTGYAMIWE